MTIFIELLDIDNIVTFPIFSSKSFKIFSKMSESNLFFKENGKIISESSKSITLENIKIISDNLDVSIYLSDIESIHINKCIFTIQNSRNSMIIIETALNVNIEDSKFINITMVENNFMIISNAVKAIFIYSQFDNIKIYDNSFIISFYSNIFITYCNFTLNEQNNGKGFLNLNFNLIISNCLIIKNILNESSFLYISNDDLMNLIEVTIYNYSIFTQNTIQNNNYNNPLLVFINGEKIIFSITDNLIFENNYALNSIIYINHIDSLFIDNLKIKNNFLSNFLEINQVKNISIMNIEYIENNKIHDNYYKNYLINKNSGPFLLISNSKYISLKQINIKNNQADSTLTGIHIKNEINLIQRIVLIEMLLCDGNIVISSLKDVLNSGNCLIIEGSDIILTNSIFSNNIIEYNTNPYLGNPCLNSNSLINSIFISNCIFYNNTAYHETICLKFYGFKFEIINSNFEKNTAKFISLTGSDVGTIELGTDNAIFQNVTISNSFSGKGAGIFFHNKYRKKFQIFKFYNLFIIKNNGYQTSGLEFDVSLGLGQFLFENSSISENSVEFYGVISTFYWTDITVYFNNCNISHNSGLSTGSGFSFYHFAGRFFINNTIFIGNEIKKKVFHGGAAIFMYGTKFTTLIYLKDNKFIENFSEMYAGAIDAFCGNFEIIDCEFINNEGKYGGSLYFGRVSIGMIKNIMIKNTLQKNKAIKGGGIFIMIREIYIYNLTIIGCKAEKGAGIYYQGTLSNLILENIVIINLVGEEGTVFFFEGPNTIILKNINITNSQSELSIIHIFLSKISVMFMNINYSKGRIFNLISSEAELKKNVFNLQICNDLTIKGCFAFSSDSLFNIDDLIISNFLIMEKESLIESDKNSEININNIILKNDNKTIINHFIYSLTGKVIIFSTNFSNFKTIIIKIENTNLTILNCNFLNNEIFEPENSIIEIYKSKYIQIENSSFLNNNGIMGGCIYLLNNLETLFLNINFIKCKSVNGGALYLKDQNITIKNNSFLENEAEKLGGAIFFDSSLNFNSKYNLLNSNFIKNNAKERGGGLYTEKSIPILKKCKFDQNTSPIGVNYSSFPMKLVLERFDKDFIDCDEDPKQCIIISNCTSGQSLPAILLSIVDFYNQKLFNLQGVAIVTKHKSESQDILSLLPDPYKLIPQNEEPILIGTNNVNMKGSYLNFSNIKIMVKTPALIWLSIKTNLIPYYSNLIRNDSIFHRNLFDIYTFNFPMILRGCLPGEIYSSDEKLCIYCVPGTYSFNPNDKMCKSCPEFVNCEGGNILSLYKGYWRSSNESIDIYECDFTSDSCLGGIKSECKEEYSGILCNSCFFDQNRKYFKNAFNYCVECDTTWIYNIFFAIFALLFLLLMIFLVRKSKNNYIEDIEDYILVKIIVNHFQTVSLITVINFKAEISEYLKNLMKFPAFLTSIGSLFLTLDCYKEDLQVSIYSFRLILSVIFSIVLIIFVISYVVISGKIEKKEKTIIKYDILNSLVFIGFFFQPSFVNFYLQNLLCDRIENKNYLNGFYEQECWDERFIINSLLITIPCLILWMGVFPLSFLIFMIKNKNKLHQNNIFQLTKFFQTGYKGSKFYWEYVELTRKFLLILIFKFFRHNYELILYSSIFFLMVFTLLQIEYTPFEKRKHNILELLSLNICFLCLFLTLLNIRNYSDQEKIIILIFVLVFNVLFIFVWIKSYFGVFKKKVSKIFSKRNSSGLSKKSKKMAKIQKAKFG